MMVIAFTVSAKTFFKNLSLLTEGQVRTISLKLIFPTVKIFSTIQLPVMLWLIPDQLWFFFFNKLHFNVPKLGKFATMRLLYSP